jgi:hypothetical protein
MARSDLAGLALAVVLAGCSGPVQLSTAPPAAVVVAPTPKTYTCAQTREAAGELAALPAGSMLRTLIDDYGDLRDKLRAALGLAPPPKCPSS